MNSAAPIMCAAKSFSMCADMAEPVLLSERSGNVLVLTMNRPNKMNALDLALTEGLVQAFEAADADADVRAVVLTGAGRAFCAGADLKEFQDENGETAALSERRSQAMRRLYRVIPGLSRPVVAAVNGFALGGGCALVLACDMALADEGAKFGYPEVRYGMVAAGVIPSLVHQVGGKTAFDLMLTARTIDAAEALRLGLINRVVSAGDAVADAVEMAETIAGYDAEAVAATKKMVHALADLSLRDGLDYVQGTDGESE